MCWIHLHQKVNSQMQCLFVNKLLIFLTYYEHIFRCARWGKQINSAVTYSTHGQQLWKQQNNAFCAEIRKKEQRSLTDAVGLLGSLNKTSEPVCKGGSPSLAGGKYQTYLQKHCFILTECTNFWYFIKNASVITICSYSVCLFHLDTNISLYKHNPPTNSSVSSLLCEL